MKLICKRKKVLSILLAVAMVVMTVIQGNIVKSNGATNEAVKITHNFTKDGTNSSFFTFSGSTNLSTSKGTVSYDNLKLTKCLKIESATTITFTPANDGSLTMVFNANTGATNIKVNGKSVSGNTNTGVLSFDVTGGKKYTLTKNSSANLFYLVYESDSSSGSESETEAPTEPETEAPTEPETETPTEPETETPVSTVISHNFTTSGTNSSFFSFSGSTNLSTSKGTVTYAGLKLTKCLKIESSTTIAFKATSDGTFTMVFNPSTGAVNIKVNGSTVKGNTTTGVLSFSVTAGKEYKLTKLDGANLFYMEYNGTGSEPETEEPETEEPETEEPETEEPETEEPETEEPTDPYVSEDGVGMVSNLSKLKDANFSNPIYVGTNGSSSASGSKSSPYDLVTAINKVNPGQAIIMLAGTYKFSSQVTIPYGNNGNANAYKIIRAADNAKVVLDCSGQSYATSDLSLNARGLQVDGDYWYISNITVYNAADNGMFITGKNNIIERCILQGNRDTGLQISRRNSSLSEMKDWPSDNLILNCTSFDNWDPKTSENADGFAAKLTCGNGNVFDGCISYCNSDDGWDLYAKSATGSIGPVTIRNCVAFGNGKLTNGSSYANGDMNGYKLGGSNGAVPTKHIVFNCMAFDNGKHGFTDNGNGAPLEIDNCTSANNVGSNYAFDRTKGGKYTDLISYRSTGTTADKFVGTISNSIYYASDKQFHIVGSAVSIASGGKVGTTFSDFSFKSTSKPYSSLQTVDKDLRNTDGTINVKGYLENTNNDGKGAKFGSNAGEQITVKASLK